MNLFLLGIIIFVIVYLFLNWFAKTSSKKIALTIKKIAVYLSVFLATILTVGGKYLFSLPFLFVVLSGLKIKGFTALQMIQLWRLIKFLKNSGRFQSQFGKSQSSSSVTNEEAYKLLGLSKGCSKDEVLKLYDERFIRMWEAYLNLSELSFLKGDNVIFQLVLTKKRDSFPLVRKKIN